MRPTKDTYLTAFGRRLARLRRAAQLTQEELGDRARLNPKYISELERAMKGPSLPVLKQLADGLDTTVLVEDEDDVGRQIYALLLKRTDAERQTALRIMRAMFADRCDP